MENYCLFNYRFDKPLVNRFKDDGCIPEKSKAIEDAKGEELIFLVTDVIPYVWKVSKSFSLKFEVMSNLNSCRAEI